jgi:hypothetical protein
VRRLVAALHTQGAFQILRKRNFGLEHRHNLSARLAGDCPSATWFDQQARGGFDGDFQPFAFQAFLRLFCIVDHEFAILAGGFDWRDAFLQSSRIILYRPSKCL